MSISQLSTEIGAEHDRAEVLNSVRDTIQEVLGDEVRFEELLMVKLSDGGFVFSRVYDEEEEEGHDDLVEVRVGFERFVLDPRSVVLHMDDSVEVDSVQTRRINWDDDENEAMNTPDVGVRDLRFD